MPHFRNPDPFFSKTGARMKFNRSFLNKNLIWWLFWCNQMPSTNRDTWFILHMCAPHSELPSNISTMTGSDLFENRIGTFWKPKPTSPKTETDLSKNRIRPFQKTNPAFFENRIRHYQKPDSTFFENQIRHFRKPEPTISKNRIRPFRKPNPTFPKSGYNLFKKRIRPFQKPDPTKATGRTGSATRPTGSKASSVVTIESSIFLFLWPSQSSREMRPPGFIARTTIRWRQQRCQMKLRAGRQTESKIPPNLSFHRQIFKNKGF